MSRTVAMLVPALLFLGLLGCQPKSPSAAHPAAAPEKPKDEADLAYITLPKKAFKSTGIQTATFESQMVQERLTLTGWIMAKPGHEVIVTAPAAGYVRPAKGQAAAPTAGERVSAEQELLILEPVLTPLDQIQLRILKVGVESELTKAKSSVENATKEYDRVLDLHTKKLKSDQDFELAKKAFEYAKEDLAAAQEKVKLFGTANIPLRAPRGGAVLALHASPGQYVAAAAPVVTIIDMQPVWVRVPVPEFDLPHIDPRQKIAITWKNGNGGGSTPAAFSAHPTGRVAQVDAQKHTADFWYELAPFKDAPVFYKDQMVTVYMPIGKKQSAVVLPCSAVVYDTHRGAWVYVDRTKADDKQHRFVRQRVQLGAHLEDGLIVQADLIQGERIVTHGAAVLFSREFHKTPVGEDDDD